MPSTTQAAVTAGAAVAAAQTTQATPPAPAGESRSDSPQVPAKSALSREQQILQWVRGPEAKGASSTPADGTGDESPPAPDASGASPDLSQSPPDGQPEATQHDEAPTGAGEDPAAGEESADAGEKPDAQGRWPSAAIERLKKLKDQRNKARDAAADKDRQVAELTERLQSLEAQLKTGTADAGPADAVETLGDVEAIRERVQSARAVQRWAEEQLELVAEDEEAVAKSLDGYGIKAPEGGWDARSLRSALRGVRDRTRVVVEEAAPRRYHWLQRESQTIDQVSRVVPELVDPKESLQAEVSQILETYPGLKAQPDWLHLATLGAWGMREWRKRLESVGKPATPATPAPAPNAVPRAPKLAGAPKVAVAAPAEGAAELEVLRERALRPGATARDREAYIRAQL